MPPIALPVRVVPSPDAFLKAWWLNMSQIDKDLVRTHVGYLPSLMDMRPWPHMIQTLVSFWDDDRMVFRFGEVELTPTIEEIVSSYESVHMCFSRKRKPDKNILVPTAWGREQIKMGFLLVNDDWLEKFEDSYIPFRKLYFRFGRCTGFEKYKHEFQSEQSWKDRRAFAFVVSLLGTLVFPQNTKHVIHPSIIMVTHALFYGVEYNSSTQYFSLAPIIVADIYRALGKCQKGKKFFQGCNLLLQWWMVKHLVKRDSPSIMDPTERSDHFTFHATWLADNKYKVNDSQVFWFKQFGSLRDEDIQWFLPELRATTHMTKGKILPFLVLAGIRGTRPYAPLRVLRQFGMIQGIPQTGDMTKFMTDSGEGEMAFKWFIIREWKAKKLGKDYAPDRFQPQISDTYKEWLKKNLAGTLAPGPVIPHEVIDVESEYQIRLHRFQERHQESEVAHLRQHREDALTIQRLQDELKRTKSKLKDARSCLIQLDDRIERQILVLDSLGHDDRARLAGTHLVMDRYHIWPEVDKAKRAGFDEGIPSDRV